MQKLVSVKEIKAQGFKKVKAEYNRSGEEVNVVWQKGRDQYVRCSHCHKWNFTRGELSNKLDGWIDIKCCWCGRDFSYK